MIRAVRNLLRLAAIARILARHDALFLLERTGVTPIVLWVARLFSRRRESGRPGQRLARALQEAGPSFIKLGQALSTRSDLLGEEMAADLSDLQDRLPPFSGAEARAAIASELGAPVEALFRQFDDAAVAAASIAQVHRAVTVDGKTVAVKVLRPGIEQAFGRDLDLFLWVAELIEATQPQWRRLKPVASVRTLADSVTLEMDLRFEAAAAAELAENFAGSPTFSAPAVHWTLTGKRVLTIDWIDGMPLDDREAILNAGLDPLAIVSYAAEAFFLQVFRDGFFHGDLHPGNMFVRADGRLVAVDFGIMGRLDRKTRRWLAELLLAFLTRDYQRVAEVHFAAGWVPPHRSLHAFAQACRSIAEPILDRPQNEISVARLLGQLFQISETFEMETQPQLLLLQKTMLVAEGTGRRLCPEANMWFLARPLIEDWMQRTLGPEARIREAVTEAAAFVSHFPEIARAIEQGSRALAQADARRTMAAARAARSGLTTRVQLLLLWIAVAVLAGRVLF
jgi:ubiquinone biosynthesis protein